MCLCVSSHADLLHPDRSKSSSPSRRQPARHRAAPAVVGCDGQRRVRCERSTQLREELRPELDRHRGLLRATPSSTASPVPCATPLAVGMMSCISRNGSPSCSSRVRPAEIELLSHDRPGEGARDARGLGALRDEPRERSRIRDLPLGPPRSDRVVTLEVSELLPRERMTEVDRPGLIGEPARRVQVTSGETIVACSAPATDSSRRARSMSPTSRSATCSARRSGDSSSGMGDAEKGRVDLVCEGLREGAPGERRIALRQPRVRLGQRNRRTGVAAKQRADVPARPRRLVRLRAGRRGHESICRAPRGRPVLVVRGKQDDAVE